MNIKTGDWMIFINLCDYIQHTQKLSLRVTTEDESLLTYRVKRHWVTVIQPNAIKG